MLSDSLFDDLEFVTSINLTGLHRTNSEIAKKNALTEKIMGSNLRYRNRNFQVGLAGIFKVMIRIIVKQFSHTINLILEAKTCFP